MSFSIGKDGWRTGYDNISNLAESLLINRNAKENINALKELDQYKDKHVTLSFNFHPWRSQDNEGMLKFVNVNKAFGEWISKFSMRLSVRDDITNETWNKLFIAIKHNCLNHKLSTFHLKTWSCLLNYYEQINQCLCNHILTLNPIKYENNQNNKYCKLKLSLDDYFILYKSNPQTRIDEIIRFNKYLVGAKVIGDIYIKFSIDDIRLIMKDKNYNFTETFFNSLYQNKSVLSLSIDFYNGINLFVQNRELIKNENNKYKYYSQDFNGVIIDKY